MRVRKRLLVFGIGLVCSLLLTLEPRAVAVEGVEDIPIAQQDADPIDSKGYQQKALEYYQRALAVRREIGDRAGEAVTLSNIGLVYYELGNNEAALNYYQQALNLTGALGIRETEAYVLGNRARAYQSQGKLNDALNDINSAITRIEDIRTNIDPGELRTSYFASVRNYYQIKIDILMQLDQPEKAFEASEAGRARSLVELLSEAKVDIRQGVDAALLDQEKSLREKLKLTEYRRVDIRSAGDDDEAINAIDQESDDILEQLDRVLSQIRRVSPAYADIVQPKPLTLTQIQQQVLDSDTVLVQYALGKERSYLWLVGKDEFQAYPLASAKDIQAAAYEFQEVIRKRRNRPEIKKVGDKLVSQILPEQPSWIEGKRLLIAGDGTLLQLPFAALPLPNQPEYTPLLTEHEILSEPSITAIAALRQQLADRPTQPTSIAVLADPVYSTDDERLQSKNTVLPPAESEQSLDPGLDPAERNLRDLGLRNGILRLPYTRAEANNIVSLAAYNNLNSIEALDFAANAEWIAAPDINQYSIIHLATHGFINPVNPQLSGIVLSLVNDQGQPQENGILKLYDIFNLKLSAELVVLSACETGLGENVSGEGVIGLSRGFMYAGARRVAVSLWSVKDEANSNLMTLFYRDMIGQDLSPAAAMQAAQLRSWEQGNDTYDWAAFTLQGEWQ